VKRGRRVTSARARAGRAPRGGRLAIRDEIVRAATADPVKIRSEG